MAIVIEDAVEADLPGMLAIYNDVILHSTAVYTDAPETLAQRENLVAATSCPRLPRSGRQGYG